MKNSSDMLVKSMVRDVLVENGIEYDRLYSNIYKADKSLRLKYFWVMQGNIKKAMKEIEKLGLGHVERVVNWNGQESIVVYVSKENVV